MGFLRNTALSSLHSSNLSVFPPFSGWNDPQTGTPVRSEITPLTTVNQQPHQSDSKNPTIFPEKASKSTSTAELTGWGFFGRDELSPPCHMVETSNSSISHQTSSCSQCHSRSSRKASSLLPRELAEQLRKGVSFTANVAGGAFRMPELKGVPKAPKASKMAVDLSTVALRVLEGEQPKYSQLHGTEHGGIGFHELIDVPQVIPNRQVKGSSIQSQEGFRRVAGLPFKQKAQDVEVTVNRTSTPSLLFDSCDDTRGMVEFENSTYSTEENHQDLPLQQNELEQVFMEIEQGAKSFEKGKSLNEETFGTIKAQDKILIEANECVFPATKCQPFQLTTFEESLVSSQPNNNRCHYSATLDKLVLMTFNAGLLEYRLGGVTWYSNPPFTKRRLYQMARKLHLKRE